MDFAVHTFVPALCASSGVRLHGRPCSFAWPTPPAVWEILKQAPTPERATKAWADFLHSQADALLAGDLIAERPTESSRHSGIW